MLYAGILFVAVVVARALAISGRLSRTPLLRLVLIAAAVLAIPLSVTPSRADVIAKAGSGFEREQRWSEAAIAHREAVRMQPRQEAYLANLARALIQEAARLDRSAREARFEEARAALESAQTLNVQNPFLPRNLASLYRIRARTADKAARDRFLAEADRLYARAVRLSPGIPALWAEWANVDAERRRFEEALDKLGRAIGFDNRYFDAWLLRGHLHALQGQPAEALADYDHALERKARDPAALRGRAMALAELRRPAESMMTIDTLLAIVPDDAVALRLRTQLQTAQ